LNVAKFGYLHLWDDPQCLGYGDNRDPEARAPSPDLWSPSSDLRLRPSDVSTSIGADDPSGDHLRVHTHTRRSLAAGAAAGVQARELLPNLPPSSSSRLQIIGIQRKFTSGPASISFVFFKI